MPGQTNLHLGQVTPFLVKSLFICIKKDYSEGEGLGYLEPIVGQSLVLYCYTIVSGFELLVALLITC